MKKAFYLFWLACTSSALAASGTINDTQRHSWLANAGWVDWKPSGGGATIGLSFCSGWIYSANVGWIHLGDGTPENGWSYSAISATDYGVNLAPGGRLTGYAWCPNAGWINFEQTHGRPSVDLITGQLTGSVWSANLGWMELEGTRLATDSILCTDTDGDGIDDAWEQQHWSKLTVADAFSDTDRDGVNDVQEFAGSTDPEVPSGRMQIREADWQLGVPRVKLFFTAVATRVYKAQVSTDLQTWTDTDSGWTSGIGSVSLLVSLPVNERRAFVRVVAAKPLPPP
jgi:hypothetical protein